MNDVRLREFKKTLYHNGLAYEVTQYRLTVIRNGQVVLSEDLSSNEVEAMGLLIDDLRGEE